MAELNKAKEFLDRVLNLIPEDKRESVRSLYSGAQDEATSLETAMANVRRTATEQSAWYTANKDALDQAKDLLAKGGTGGVSESEIAKRLEQMRDDIMGQGLSLMTVGTTIAGNHMKEFGEPLDMQVLADEAIKAGKTLQAYYDQKVAPKRAEVAETALQLRLKAAKDEGVKEGTQATLARIPGAAMPYPVGQNLGVSTLDGLKKAPEGQAPQDVVQAAAQTAVETLNRQTTQ